MTSWYHDILNSSPQGQTSGRAYCGQPPVQSLQRTPHVGRHLVTQKKTNERILKGWKRFVTPLRYLQLLASKSPKPPCLATLQQQTTSCDPSCINSTTFSSEMFWLQLAVLLSAANALNCGSTFCTAITAGCLLWNKAAAAYHDFHVPTRSLCQPLVLAARQLKQTSVSLCPPWRCESALLEQREEISANRL